MSAEDYTGDVAVWHAAATEPPDYLSYYADALDANGVAFDVYDVDAHGRTAPDSLGVLGHYDAVVWYTGDDLVTREPVAGGRAPRRLAMQEMLEVRDYVNEGGRVLYTGRSAGSSTPRLRLRPLRTRPVRDNVDQSVAAAAWLARPATRRATRSSTGSARPDHSRTAAAIPRPGNRSTSPASTDAVRRPRLGVQRR